MSEFIESCVGWFKPDERLPPLTEDDYDYALNSPDILFQLQNGSVYLGRVRWYENELPVEENIQWTEAGRDGYRHESATVIGWAYATPTTVPFALPDTND